MNNIFTEHPHSVGESYLQHLKFASLFGLQMMIGGVACFFHAFFPFIFQKTGSNMLLGMTQHFIERMPTLEDRILYLATLIQEKKAKADNSSSNEICV